MLKHLRIIYESCTNKGKFVAVLDNSWDLLSTIRYKMPFTIYPCLGITSKINVYRRAAVVLALHLECQYQLLKIWKRLRRKKIRRDDPDFLTLWLEKLLVKVYHHHHQPVDHQSLTDLINLPLLFHSWSLCILLWEDAFASVFSYFLACFHQLRIPEWIKNTYECTRIG